MIIIDFLGIFCASVLSLSLISFGFIFIIIDITDDRELKGRINEKSLTTLKDQLKKSKTIDQQQAARLRSLLEESLALLRQKKITRE